MDLIPLNGICYAGETKAITSRGAIALELLTGKNKLEFLTPWGLKPGKVIAKGPQRCKTLVLRRAGCHSQYNPFRPIIRAAPVSHDFNESDEIETSCNLYKEDFDHGFVHGMTFRYGIQYEPHNEHANIRKFSFGYKVKQKHILTLLPFLNARQGRECVIDSHSSTEVFFRTSFDAKHFPNEFNHEGYHSGFIHGFFSLPSKVCYPSSRFRLYFYDSLDHKLSDYILGHALFAGWLINPVFNHERYQVLFDVIFDKSFIVHKTEIETKIVETFCPLIEDFPKFIVYPGFQMPCNTPAKILNKNCISFCVSKETLIHTTEGPQYVKNLFQKKFKGISQALDRYPTKKQGFVSLGEKQLFEITTEEGFDLKATSDQEFRTAFDPRMPLFSISHWIKLSDLKVGDKIQLSTHLPHSWSGPSTFSHGWILTALMFQGSLNPINGSDLTGTGTLHFKDYDPEFFLPLARKIATYSLPYRSTHENSRIVSLITDGSFYSVAKKFGLSLNPFYISDEIEFTSNDFYKGFLQGIMDFASETENSKEIKIAYPKFTIKNYKAIQRMFLRIGIMTVLKKNFLAMDEENFTNFLSQTGFTHPNKTKQFKHLIPSWDYQFPGVHTVKIKTITPAGKEKVYSSYLPTFDGNGFLLKGLT
jgi:hypothetical protein